MVSARPLVWRGRRGPRDQPGARLGGGGRWSWLCAGRGVPVTGQGPGWRDPTPKERVSSSTEALGGQGHQGPSGGTRGREGAVGRGHRGLSSGQGLPCGWDSQPGLWPSPGGGLCGLRPVAFPLWSSVPSSILWAFSPRLPPWLSVGSSRHQERGQGLRGFKTHIPEASSFQRWTLQG